MKLDLSGKTALITGGSSGLGFAMAKSFVLCGAKTIILARDETRLRKAKIEIDLLGLEPLVAISCDLTDASTVAVALSSLITHKISPDILVNNAGSSARSNFLDLTEDQLLSDFRLKLFSAIQITQHALPDMKSRRYGRIINVTAIVGKTPNAGSSPTALSRAAGLAWTKSLSLETAPFGITVNSLCVGKIISGQWERRYENSVKEESYEDYLKKLGSPIPMLRMGHPEEFANVATFLASDLASYVTGCAINVDGGLCAVT